MAEILRYTVAQSDNNGCDILLGLLGGPATVNDFIHGLGIKDMAIRYDEARMQRDWQAQFANWSTPWRSPACCGFFIRAKFCRPPAPLFSWK